MRALLAVMLFLPRAAHADRVLWLRCPGEAPPEAEARLLDALELELADVAVEAADGCAGDPDLGWQDALDRARTAGASAAFTLRTVGGQAAIWVYDAESGEARVRPVPAAIATTDEQAQALAVIVRGMLEPHERPPAPPPAMAPVPVPVPVPDVPPPARPTPAIRAGLEAGVGALSTFTLSPLQWGASLRLALESPSGLSVFAQALFGPTVHIDRESWSLDRTSIPIGAGAAWVFRFRHIHVFAGPLVMLEPSRTSTNDRGFQLRDSAVGVSLAAEAGAHLPHLLGPLGLTATVLGALPVVYDTFDLDGKEVARFPLAGWGLTAAIAAYIP